MVAGFADGVEGDAAFEEVWREEDPVGTTFGGFFRLVGRAAFRAF